MQAVGNAWTCYWREVARYGGPERYEVYRTVVQLRALETVFGVVFLV
jgi:hypothetical protein